MNRIILILAILYVVCLSSYSQIFELPVYTKDKRIPACYAIPDSVDIIKGEINNSRESQISRILKLNEATTLVFHDTFTDIVGGFHETYKEFYNGIEVNGTQCIVHYSRTGHAFPRIAIQ